MLRRISIFWVLLAAIALTSAIPIGYIAFLENRNTKKQLEQEAEERFQESNRNQANLFSQEMGEFSRTTSLAAIETQNLLTSPPEARLTEAEVVERFKKYDFGGPNDLFSLDKWYEEEYFPKYQNALVSNVFVQDNTDITESMRYTIAVTELLDPLFAALGNSLNNATYIGTHNIYLITTNGVMRQYPFVDNNFAPVGTYTDLPDYADTGPVANPDRAILWSIPSLDFRRDGSLYVINTVPIYDGDNYLGVMAHDLDLKEITEVVNQLEIGEKGLAFMVNSEGYIMVHPDYNPTQVWQSLSPEEQDQMFEEGNFDDFYAQYVDVQPKQYFPGLERETEKLVNERPIEGFTTFEYEDETWVLAYHLVPETGWYLMYIQPQSEFLARATQVSDRVQTAGVVALVGVLFASFILAGFITRPVTRLAKTAKAIESSVDDETAQAINATLGQLDDLQSVAEINNLARFFEQMVHALSARMVELNSIYTIGQTISSSVDYETTVNAVLDSVRQFSNCDAVELAVKRSTSLVVEGWRGNADYFRNTTGVRYESDDNLVGKVIKSPEPVFLPFLSAHENLPMETAQKQVHSLMVIPLLSGKNLVAALVLTHHQSGFFTEDMRRQLLKLAGQASIAVDNAIKVKEREDSLQRQIIELKVAVDETKRETSVQEISESDFFKDLQANAAKLRKRSEEKNKPAEGE